ncbi:MAG TPA: superoxide dismutase [Gammaproteobacteria bacterium]|jgi:Fe-Mn family superoxide dismutase
MKFELPELPYPIDALEPHIAAQTLDVHYSKHHRGYLEKLEKALAGTPQAEDSLEHIVCSSDGKIFNNAAQVWNHTFYWNSMTANGVTPPGGDLAARLAQAFGGVDEFKREFAEAANGQFGSGWAWLVETREGNLKVLSTSNADNPMCDGYRPLLTADVWEHAYYLDYQNERDQYVEAFLEHLINWRFAESNLRGAGKDQQAASA